MIAVGVGVLAGLLCALAAIWWTERHSKPVSLERIDQQLDAVREAAKRAENEETGSTLPGSCRPSLLSSGLPVPSEPPRDCPQVAPPSSL